MNQSTELRSINVVCLTCWKSAVTTHVRHKCPARFVHSKVGSRRSSDRRLFYDRKRGALQEGSTSLSNIYIYICKLGCVFSSGDPESLDLGLISLHLPWGLTTRGRIDLLSPSIDLLSPEWFATEEVARRLRAPRRLEVRQRGSAIGVWLSVGRRLTAYHLACS